LHKEEEENMIIVTGFYLEPDIYSRQGWSTRAYARVVPSIEGIKDDETVWSGVLNWTPGDPEGRFDSGWMGPHGLIVSDREHEAKLANALADLRRLQEAIKVAEEGHSSQEWDDVTQEWVTIKTPPTDGEIAAGLAAMEAIDGLRKWVEEAQTRTVNGAEAAAQLEALRNQRQEAKEKGEVDINDFPQKLKSLWVALDHPERGLRASVYQDLVWYTEKGGVEIAKKRDIRPFWDAFAKKAAKFNNPSWTEEEREAFRRFWED
jgi:hypothetical protein